MLRALSKSIGQSTRVIRRHPETVELVEEPVYSSCETPRNWLSTTSSQTHCCLNPRVPLYGHVVCGVATANCSSAETRRATSSLPLRTELVVSHQHCCRSETVLKTRKCHTVLGRSWSYHFDMCVWLKVETVIHDQSQSS